MNKNEQDKYIIHRYIDGELSKEEAASFEERLAASAELRREAESLRNVGSDLKQAFRSEIEDVDFGPVWASVEESMDAKRVRSETIFQFIANLFATRRFAVAVSAAAVVLMCVAVAVVLMWKMAIAPGDLEAAATTVETIDYGNNPDIVITVDTLGNSVTTVVWVQDFETDEDTLPE